MNIHKNLAQGRWLEFSLIDQLANVGTDVERAFSWKERGSLEDSESAFERAMELLQLTILDPKNRRRGKELARVKEALLDSYYGFNTYGYTTQAWRQYFYCFAYASALKRGR